MAGSHTKVETHRDPTVPSLSTSRICWSHRVRINPADRVYATPVLNITGHISAPSLRHQLQFAKAAIITSVSTAPRYETYTGGWCNYREGRNQGGLQISVACACRVCRAFGLTRSFEQEDMHELAKVAGFISDYSTGSSGSSILSAEQWDRFGAWFLRY